MEALAEEAAAAPERWTDPVGRLLDAFAQRYRERPGYRALWFGREMTPGLRAADRDNKAALAGGLEQVLRTLGLGDGAHLETASRAGVLIADALLQEAFRSDGQGEPALIEEAKRVLRLYLADVLARA